MFGVKHFKRTIFATHDTRGRPLHPRGSHIEVDEDLWQVHHRHRAHRKTPSRCFRRRVFQRRHTSARPVCPVRTMSGNATLELSNLDRIRAGTSSVSGETTRHPMSTNEGTTAEWNPQLKEHLCDDMLVCANMTHNDFSEFWSYDFLMIKYDCLLSYAVDRLLESFMRSARQ